MAPQIIDLLSDDDEDFDPSSRPTAKRRVRHPRLSHSNEPGRGTRQDFTSENPQTPRETIDLNTLPRNTVENEYLVRINASRSSTVSSHTERGSPTEPLNSIARRDNDRGKQRQIEISEIDLSQDGDDLGEKNLSSHDEEDASLGYDNGDLSEDEALRQAIALSLQEQTPRRHANNEAGASANLSSTTVSKAQGKQRSNARPLKETAPARPADEVVVDAAPDNGVISLSPTPSHRTPPSSHAMTKVPLPSLGSTRAPPPASADQSLPNVAQDGPELSLDKRAPDLQVSNQDPSASHGVFSLASLDRRQMEAERLARRKRKLEDEGSHDARSQESEGRNAKALKRSQPVSVMATDPRVPTGTGIAKTQPTQSNEQHPGHGVRKDSNGSRHHIQLPERNIRETAQAASSFQTGQRTGAAKPASQSSKARIPDNKNGKGNNSHVVAAPTDTAAPNPIRTNPPCIEIDDDDDGDDDGEGYSNNTFGTSINNSTANLYPDGIALKTYVTGYPSDRTITFERVVSPSSQLESCLLSSFIWDFDWLLPHFETRRTKFQLVMHAKDAQRRQAVERDFQGVPNVRLTFPRVGGNISCMHSKLMLLFYKDEGGEMKTGAGAVAAAEASTMGQNGLFGAGGGGWQQGSRRCRIVVPTANLVDFDWGVGGFMENTVWLIDLPVKQASDATTSSSSYGATSTATPPVGDSYQTFFEKSLKEFLRAQTVPDDVLHKLDLFDFRKTERYGFVHSIGGTHVGQAWQTTGVCGLGRTITDLGLAAGADGGGAGRSGPVQMDYVSSSIGNLNDEFLQSMYLAASGDNGLRAVDRRGPLKQQGSWKKNLRFYYPSDNTVRTSKGGPDSAGTVCFSSAWWNSPQFPRSSMYECVSVREGLLMHNKVRFIPWT
ncbi:hypothetical protein Z517_07987 [Fonsecaea pedrosoi CBS 271.37]|uniref:Unplaced genomic scaffold supercont1.5, whole genome shotgun sequence n=1 Tax=Fonsecaea pedrosoi CBS 271.37 TaxID=1442368 RepID=A0A0D2H0G1_9EURO|nr:uncharacterized protein Z517_07987 [Fonsecaea pedrosoi CBS 271.37]KIW78154.1 hypothetical protein Z517_07987 [Fonsecaea pedrosoi CBS 271.37]